MYHSKKENTLSFCDLGGMAYVKNRDGKTSNVNFFINGRVNTLTDEISVTFTVTAFKKEQNDYYYEVFTKFSDAEKAYNELSLKFNASEKQPSGI